MSATFTESVVEGATLGIFVSLDYAVLWNLEVAPAE
jgi:hypothetical protein